MVRRRTDESDPWGRVARLCDRVEHLVAGELATLAGLGALRHLDLVLIGVREILDRDTEPAGGDLFDRRPLAVTVGERCESFTDLPTLAGVRFAADAVHRHRQRLVRLEADRTVAHRPGGEPLHDFLDRLHLIDRHRRALPEPQQSPQGCLIGTALILVRREAPERRAVALSDGALEVGDRLRVPHVLFAAEPPLVVAGVEIFAADGHIPRRPRQFVPPKRLPRQLPEPRALNATGRPDEGVVHDVVCEADDLEDLCPLVALQRTDAHLAEHLAHALLDRVLIGADDLLPGKVVPDLAVVLQVPHRLEGEVRVDRVGAVPDKGTEVVDLTGFAALHDNPDPGPRVIPN